MGGGGKLLAVIDIIREKVRNRQYEFTFPHFFEEMANDNLTFRDIEMALTRGRVRSRVRT